LRLELAQKSQHLITDSIWATYLAGVYGMNFTNMPELQHQNGYFILLAGMALVAILLLFYFKRKKWL
jgi:magnesium transporter